MNVIKVKKTYGKQKTVPTTIVLPRKSINNNDTLEDSYWNKDDTFDRLLFENKLASCTICSINY